MLKFTKISHSVRDFLFKILNKKFLIFLFFLLLSGCFWLLMTLNETYEQDLPVVVKVIGVPKNVVMTSETSDTTYVTVRDKGFVLLSYLTTHKLRPLYLNFATYANKQTGHGQISASDLLKFIRPQLFASSVVTTIKADQVDFYFNYGRHKQVKITLDGNVVPGDKYYLAQVQFSPEKVTVYANNRKLDSIHAVSTDYLNVFNFTDTVVKTVKLKPMKGVKIVPNTVKVTLCPDILTEESMEIPITTINKPQNIVIRTFPQRVKVRFTVGAAVYRTINPSDFQVVVDYRQIAEHPSDKCNLYLKSKPRGISNAKLDMNQVDYLIEQ